VRDQNLRFLFMLNLVFEKLFLPSFKTEEQKPDRNQNDQNQNKQEDTASHWGTTGGDTGGNNQD